MSHMNVISHIVYPVVIAQSANIYRTHKEKPSLFHWKQLLLIGLCGGLPDILSPHLALGSRYNSYTHSLWFLLAGLVIAVVLARKFKRYRKLIYVCWFAVLFHLFCDMIAGGINLLAPFGEMIVGRHYLPFNLWIPLDIAGVLILFIPPIYNKVPARARSLVLVSGLAVAIGTPLVVFSLINSEIFLLKRISASEVDPVQLESTYQVINTLFEKWQAGVFEPLSDTFTEEMKEAMNPQMQKSNHESTLEVFGDYQGIEFAEAVTARFFLSRDTLYRFRIKFSKMEHPSEIGLVINSNGKISGVRMRREYISKVLD